MSQSEPSAHAAAAEGTTATSVRTPVPSLGVDVHSRVCGQTAGGTPIVLVHGVGLSSRYLVPLGQRLAALGYHVLAPDLPGFGKTRTSLSASAPTVAEQAEQLLAWMDAVGIERAVLFGNSVGTQVTVEVAVRQPQRVERLVLEGPTPDPKYRTPLRQYPRVLRNMMFEAPSLNSVYQAEYASAAMIRMFRQLRKTVDDPIEQRLPHVQVPALVVRGRFDQTLSQAWAEQFTALLPDARLVVVEGAAHNVHYSAPHVVARLMDGFLTDGWAALTPTSGDVVLDGPDDVDPLAPRQPMSLRMHGALDVLGTTLALVLPRKLGAGPRTRLVLMAAASTTTLNGFITDAPFGVLRKAPMTFHLNVDSLSGMQLLWAATRLLRGEPAAGRWVVAALGAYELVAANITRKPMGPARVVPVTPPAEPVVEITRNDAASHSAPNAAQ
jgi:pimeloyl-ACP methyl ester carboxylesterase